MAVKSLLILSHKPPYPKVDGGAVAMSQLLEQLINKGYKVDYLYMTTHKHKGDAFPKHPNLNYQSVAVNTELKFIPICLNVLLSSNSYILSRFNDEVFKKEILKKLKTNIYNTVVFESLFTLLYSRFVTQNSDAKRIYRSHNIEHRIWDLKSKNETSLLRKAYLKIQTSRLKKEELSLWNDVDKIASISSNDSSFIKDHCSTETHTLGFSIKAKKSTNKMHEKKKSADFFHIGAMDWLPNKEALEWLSTAIWPMFNNTHKGFSLHLAGKSMSIPSPYQNLESCIVHGEVNNAELFMEAHDIMLVPLKSGSGLRIKIVEGLALGKCIIGTSIAFKGLKVESFNQVIIANNTIEFVEAMSFCIKNPDRVANIKANGQKFAETNFSESQFVKTLEKIF